jgi:hypothetical protein
MNDIPPISGLVSIDHNRSLAGKTAAEREWRNIHEPKGR